MEFRQCSVGGKIYKGQPLPSPSLSQKKLSQGSSGNGLPPRGAQSLFSEGSTVADPSPPLVLGPKHGETLVPPRLNHSVSMPPVNFSEGTRVHFYDPAILNDLRANDVEGHSKLINDFFTTLALCHTVLTGIDPQTRAISYKAQSPDEAALVQAAADVGYVFLGREPSSNVVRLQTPTSPTPHRHEMLNVLEFTSLRKRMSVILRQVDGEGAGTILLLCKGADQVIFENMGPGQEKIKEKTGEDLDFFANEGLRTLCLAHKILNCEYPSVPFFFLRSC